MLVWVTCVSIQMSSGAGGGSSTCCLVSVSVVLLSRMCFLRFVLNLLIEVSVLRLMGRLFQCSVVLALKEFAVICG